MRVSIVSIILAGGLLTLCACATAQSTPMTMAERAEQCPRTGLEPTGRQTGDARHDYKCQGSSALGYREGARSDGHAAAGRERVMRQGG